MSKQVKNIVHLEDKFLEQGLSGLHSSINDLFVLQQLIAGVKNDYTLTTKYDGAPSIVCGIHPKTNKFFVGTKSVFNKKNPKINYDAHDIRNNYPGNMSLTYILNDCLHYLFQLGIKNILQGDLMYSGLSKQFTGSHITFQPNTVKYGIPYFTDLANRIMNSQIGIIFHTQYTNDWNASSNPNLSNLNYTSDVWFRDASFTILDSITMDSSRIHNLKKRATKLKASVINKFFVNKKINTLTNLFFNYIIRENNQYDDGEILLEDLHNFCHLKINSEVDQAIKSDTKLRKLDEKDEILRFFQVNSETLIELFDLVLLLVIEKHLIIDILNNNDGSGLIPDTHHEGFVLSDQNHNLTKLVNRREFSAKNFANTKWEE